MDILTIKALQYHAKHGYFEKERRDGNLFEVDLIFHSDLQAAAKSDDLEDTVDYREAEKMVRDIMEGPSQKLIESLAKKIGENLFKTFNKIDKLQVNIRKLSPPLPANTKYSEVTMTWNR